MTLNTKSSANTHFRTWKSGKKWLYAAATLTILLGQSGNFTSLISPTTVSANTTTTPSSQTPPPIIISQIYSGAGNTGAEYNTKYVVLYNTTNNDIPLNGYFLDYEADSTDGSYPTAKPNIVPLGNKGVGADGVTGDATASIPAHDYYIAEESPTQGGTNPLPTADATTSKGIKVYSENIMLYNANVQGANTAGYPTATNGTADPGIVDYVAYGDNPNNDSNAGQGLPTVDTNLNGNSSDAPAPELSPTTALVRKAIDPTTGLPVDPTTGAGLGLPEDYWTGDNANDFVATSNFTPFNSQTPTLPWAVPQASMTVNQVIMNADGTSLATGSTVTMNVYNATIPDGSIPVSDFTAAGLPDGLSITSATGNSTAGTVTLTIGGTATTPVTASTPFSVSLTSAFASNVNTEGSLATATGFSVAPNVAPITATVGNSDVIVDSTGAISSTDETFTVKLTSGTIKDGALDSSDFTVTGLPAGLTVAGTGDASTNTATFTVSGTPTTAITDDAPLSIVLHPSAVSTANVAASSAITGAYIQRALAVPISSVTRSQNILDSVTQQNDYFSDAATKDYKYTSAMGVSASQFYRGAPNLFYQDLGTSFLPTPTLPASAGNLLNTWVEGDSHINNIGVYSDSQGNVVFGLNDFDEAYIAPFWTDLARFSSALYTNMKDSGVTLNEEQQNQLVQSFMDSYYKQIQAIDNGTVDPTTAELTQANTPSNSLEYSIMGSALKSDTLAKQLGKYEVGGNDAAGQLDTSSDQTKLSPATAQETSDITSNWNNYIASLPAATVSADQAQNPNYFKILSMGERVDMGDSSVGSKRFYVLIEGPSNSNNGANATNIILDVKQEVQPTLLQSPAFGGSINSSTGMTTPATSLSALSDPGTRVIDGKKALLVNPDALAGTLSFNNDSFSVQTLNAQKEDVVPETAQDYRDVALAAGQMLANAHAKGYSNANLIDGNSTSNTFAQNLLAAFPTQASWNTFSQTLNDSSENYALQAESDYSLFENLLSNNELDVTAPTFGSNASLTATSTTASSVTLNWNAAKNNQQTTASSPADFTTIQSYKIFENGGETPVATVSGMTTSAKISGLTAGKNYTFTVQAFDGANNESTNGSSLSITPSDDPASTPTTPTKPSTPAKPTSSATVPVYCLYNPNTGQHYYTESNYEKSVDVKAGWKYEGIAWQASKKVTNIPVYCVYNPNSGEHLYTTSNYEAKTLAKIGWKNQGIAFYSAGTVPVYRLYNPNTGEHYFTESNYEKNVDVKAGWQYEGIAWHASH